MNLASIVKHMLGDDRQMFRLAEVDILSPYVSASFFESLFTHKPRTVRLTTDIACPQRDRDAIVEVAKKKLANIRVGQCNGIVHAKLFLFHWQNKTTQRYRRFLLWGSSNATDGGFGRNAECLSMIALHRFSPDDRAAVLAYFKALQDDDSVESVTFQVDGLTLMLPSFNLTKQSEDFLTWLQRGRLCNPFPPDSTFRRLKVQLLAPINAQDPVSTEFRRHQISLSQQTAITYDFLRAESTTIDADEDADFDHQLDADSVTNNWRAKYFVHTIYGHWTSAECYNALRDQFVKRDYEERAREIEIVANSTSADWRRWEDAFLQILAIIANRVDGADRFLRLRDGQVDEASYRVQFRNQIDRQVARARDPWFKRSYVSGFSFVELPAMRETSSIWNEFQESFGDALASEIGRPRTRQMLARLMRKQGIVELGTNGNEVISAIEGSWGKHGRLIRTFFVPPRDA